MAEHKRESVAEVLSDPVRAAAEASFLGTLERLRDCAADVAATPAQCVACLRAVSSDVEPLHARLAGSDVSSRSIGDMRRAELAAKAHVLSLLAAVMRAHAGDARVQAAGCDLLVCVVQVCPRALYDESADVAAAVDAVLAATCAHTADLAAHFRACEAINGLCTLHAGAPCAVPRERVLAACDAVCAARGIHTTCAVLLNMSLLTLGHLCRVIGVHAGALNAALAALRASGNDMSVACRALTGMAEGSVEDADLLTLCDAAAADVIAAMRTWLPTNSRLQTRGAMALAKMAETAETAARVAAAGGIEAVVDAVRMYNAQNESGRWWDVEESAWYALLILTRSDDAQTQRAIDAGVLALPPAANEEGIEERRVLFERMHALQRRHADAAAAQQAAALAAAALRADAAMEALLAEEEAERAAKAGGKAAGGGKAKPKRNKAARAAAAARAADDAAAPATAAGAAPPSAAAATADATAGAAPPSKAAARRMRVRRRAATEEATRQQDAVDSAAAASALQPSGAEANSGSADDVFVDARDDDAAPLADDAAAALSDALAQSAHIVPPAAPHADVAAAVQAALAAQAAMLAEHEARAACAICLDAPRCMALLPCKHLTNCTAPACFAMLGAPPRCPLCRTVVTDTMQLFV